MIVVAVSAWSPREAGDELGGELVEVGLHRPQLPIAPPEEREVRASAMCRLQMPEDLADVVVAVGELGDGQGLP